METVSEIVSQIRNIHGVENIDSFYPGMLGLLNKLEAASKSTPPEKGVSGEGDELSELREWKRQAIEVMPDFQEIGKLLNIPLGKSVSDNIIPKIKELLAASHPSPHTPVNLEDVKKSLRHNFYKSTGRYYIDTPYTYIESLEKKIAEYRARKDGIPRPTPNYPKGGNHKGGPENI